MPKKNAVPEDLMSYVAGNKDANSTLAAARAYRIYLIGIGDPEEAGPIVATSNSGPDAQALSEVDAAKFLKDVPDAKLNFFVLPVNHNPDSPPAEGQNVGLGIKMIADIGDSVRAAESIRGVRRPDSVRSREFLLNVPEIQRRVYMVVDDETQKLLRAAGIEKNV